MLRPSALHFFLLLLLFFMTVFPLSLSACLSDARVQCLELSGKTDVNAVRDRQGFCFSSHSYIEQVCPGPNKADS